MEACVTSVEEARTAEDAAADRVELCVSLEVGGLTPSPDLLEAVKASCTLPVCVLLRHRPDFRSMPADVDRLIRDVADYAAMGVDGVVTGVLDGRGRIDGAALADVVSAAAGTPVVFHRAFDELADPHEGIERLMDAGVARVLTSGGATTAWEGRATLRELVALASDRITVLAGGRIRADHVNELVRETGVREVHARASAVAALAATLAGRRA